MQGALAVALQQWPSLAALILFAGGFWVIFKQSLIENQNILKSYIQLIDKIKHENNSTIFEYTKLAAEHKIDSDRYRIIVRSLLDENEKIRRSYDEIKSSLSRVLFENQSLRRTVDRLEEMVRAVGGDFRVISVEISKAREDIKAVSDQVDSIARLEQRPDGA
jgi:chromosome segregation ATPase